MGAHRDHRMTLAFDLPPGPFPDIGTLGGMSVKPSTADITVPPWQVGYVPVPELCRYLNVKLTLALNFAKGPSRSSGAGALRPPA